MSLLGSTNLLGGSDVQSCRCLGLKDTKKIFNGFGKKIMGKKFLQLSWPGFGGGGNLLSPFPIPGPKASRLVVSPRPRELGAGNCKAA